MAELRRGTAPLRGQDSAPTRPQALIAAALAALVVLVAAGVALARAGISHPAGHTTPGPPLLVVDARHPTGAKISPLLFGLGVDLPAATYVPPGGCSPLAGVDAAATLVRIGAATADDYDWPTDSYVAGRPGHPIAASSGCPTSPDRAGATVLRVLDRARALHVAAVVVLNGEVDDPQAAAGLVRLVVRRYGLAFARQVYWEIGNAPATWRHFGVPLSARRASEAVACLPDQYAALVIGYAAALAAALDGAPPRIVADQWIANATDQAWTDVVAAVDTPYYPFSSPAVQPASASQVAQAAWRVPQPAGVSLDQRLFSLRANLTQPGSSNTPPLFVGSWNVDANTSSANPANPLYGADAQAAFVASLVLHLAQDGVAIGVAMAAWAQPLYTSAQAPFTADGAPTPAFHVLTALRALAGARLATVAGAGSAAPLNALAARLPDGQVAVALVNTAARDTVLRLRVQGLAHAVSARVQTFSRTTPAGATTHLAVAPAGARLHVPAFGVLFIEW